MIGAMDLDLWHLSDTLEENAINEKCCVEVLNRLIAKADEELFDLEDDLAILQSQLRWTEHAEQEKLYEVWCATLRKKIMSLGRSLQTLRKGYAPNNHTLDEDSETHHKSVDRIHDIIHVLLEQNVPTESKKVKDRQKKNQGPKVVTIVPEGDATLEDLDNIKAVEPVPPVDPEKAKSSSKKGCMISNADLEERENTAAVSARLDSSRKPDNKQIIGTENPPMTANTNTAKDLLHVPDVKLTEMHGLASERRERPSISEPDCHKTNVIESQPYIFRESNSPVQLRKVLDNNIKDESIALRGAKAVKGSEAILFHQQECEVKGENEPLLRAPPPKLLLPRSVKVEFNENEPLATLLSSQGPKRRKLEPTSARSKTKAVEKRNQKLRTNGMNAANPSSKPSPTSEDSGRNQNSIRNVGPASSSMSSHAGDLTEGEKHTQETAASECTRDKLEKMNRAELITVAKSNGLKGYSKIKKSLIVDRILEKRS